MSFVEKVKEFNQIAGTFEQFDEKKVALYSALLLEEMAEHIESYNCEQMNGLQAVLEEYSKLFKQGFFADYIKNVDRLEYLDSCVDLAVVALGGGIAIGSDIESACEHIADNNLTKFPIIDGQRTVLKDPVSGKVLKPETYQSPNLEPYLK